MKIQELIEKLQELQKQTPDIDVTVFDKHKTVPWEREPLLRVDHCPRTQRVKLEI